MPLLRTRQLVLDANGEGVLHDGGDVVLFDTSGSSVSIDITWIDGGGQEAGKVQGVLLGRLLRAGGGFAGLRVTGGDPNDTIKLLVGPTDAYARESVTNAVIGNVTVINEVEVKNDAGNPLAVEGTVTESQGAAIAHNAAVAVNNVLTNVLAAGARRRVRLYNQGPDAVAIGSGAGLTWAKRARVLEMGDSYEDEVTAQLAVDAICDAAKTATLGVEVVT